LGVHRGFARAGRRVDGFGETDLEFVILFEQAFHFTFLLGVPMSKSLYVGNLPFSASEDEVRELFSQHGSVLSVKLISDRDTGRPRGFGFVEMEAADATAAAEALNGYSFGGRALKVNEAQPRQPRQPRW